MWRVTSFTRRWSIAYVLSEQDITYSEGIQLSELYGNCLKISPEVGETETRNMSEA